MKARTVSQSPHHSSAWEKVLAEGERARQSWVRDVLLVPVGQAAKGAAKADYGRKMAAAGGTGTGKNSDG